LTDGILVVRQPGEEFVGVGGAENGPLEDAGGAGGLDEHAALQDFVAAAF
jgi:hypothetical protein